MYHPDIQQERRRKHEKTRHHHFPPRGEQKEYRTQLLSFPRRYGVFFLSNLVSAKMMFLVLFSTVFFEIKIKYSSASSSLSCSFGGLCRRFCYSSSSLLLLLLLLFFSSFFSFPFHHQYGQNIFWERHSSNSVSITSSNNRVSGDDNNFYPHQFHHHFQVLSVNAIDTTYFRKTGRNLNQDGKRKSTISSASSSSPHHRLWRGGPSRTSFFDENPSSSSSSSSSSFDFSVGVSPSSDINFLPSTKTKTEEEGKIINDMQKYDGKKQDEKETEEEEGEGKNQRYKNQQQEHREEENEEDKEPK